MGACSSYVSELVKPYIERLVSKQTFLLGACSGYVSELVKLYIERLVSKQTFLWEHVLATYLN